MTRYAASWSKGKALSFWDSSTLLSCLWSSLPVRLNRWTPDDLQASMVPWFPWRWSPCPPLYCGASSFMLARSSLIRASVEVDFDPKRSRSVPGRDRMALSWPVPGRLCSQQLGSDSPRTWPKHTKITKERNMALRGIDVDTVHTRSYRIFQPSLSHKATPCPGPLFDVFSRWPRIWKCCEKTRIIVTVEQCLLGVVVSWHLFFLTSSLQHVFILMREWFYQETSSTDRFVAIL